MTRADLTVRGGGIFGLSIAYAAVLQGARVRLIETVRIGAGSSGGVVGALSPHVPEAWNAKKEFQLDSLLMAADWWAGVEAASGLPSGYARLGRLQPLGDDRAVAAAQARALTAQTLWRGQAIWQVIAASGDAWQPASPTGLLIHDTLSARLHPRLAAQSLLAAITALGGSITDDPTHHGPVIWATGTAGLADLTADLGRPAGTGIKGQAALLRHEARDQPHLFIDGLHIVPHADGTVAIGSTSENRWSDPTSTDSQLERLIDTARAVLPALAKAPVIERWAALRPRAPSRAPLLGPWPGRPGHYIANGGFKIGFGMAPKIAEVMADLLLRGIDAIPPEFHTDALAEEKSARR